MINAVPRIFDVGNKPLLDAVNLKIDPPDSRRAKYKP